MAAITKPRFGPTTNISTKGTANTTNTPRKFPSIPMQTYETQSSYPRNNNYSIRFKSNTQAKLQEDYAKQKLKTSAQLFKSEEQTKASIIKSEEEERSVKDISEKKDVEWEIAGGVILAVIGAILAVIFLVIKPLVDDIFTEINKCSNTYESCCNSGKSV